MPKIVKYKGYKFRINSYTYSGNMANADWYYGKGKMKGWNKVVNLQMRRDLALKFPKGRSRIKKYRIKRGENNAICKANQSSKGFR